MESLRFIASTVLGGTSTSVTFSNIDNQTYQDLFFLINARTDRGAVADTYELRINGDTGANYTSRGTSRADAGSTSAFNNASGTGSIFDAGYTNGGNSGSTEMGGSRGWLYNIADTSNGKIWQSENYAEGNVMYISGNWQNYDKVTSITLLPGTGTNFTANSSFCLYGLIAPFPTVIQ